MPLAFKGLYRFDEFEVDPSKRAFLRSGTPVLISPKAFDVLLYLVANAGRVVTKEELLRAIWPDSFVEESNLAQHVSWLRKGLADKSNYVVTVPGRGYQFTAEVRTEVPPHRSIALIFDGRAWPLDAPASAENFAPGSELDRAGERSSSEDEAPVATQNHRNWKTVAAVAAFGLVILVAGFFGYKKWAAARSRPPVSIAVLPFSNQTGDPAKEYVSDGVTEEMINGLTRVEGGKLKVIARTSAMSFKSSGKSAAEIAKELGVEYVLAGSVKAEGSRLHVTAELIRGDNQTYVWADSFDGDSGQILEFENHVTDAVARSLSLTLLAEKTSEHIPVSNEAHEAYLQGLYFLAQRSKTGLENALQSFGTAVAKDPQYARAYAQLAVTYNLLGQFSWMSTDQARSQARAAALQAIAADGNLAEAHAALGFNSWFYDWNPRAGEAELLEAIRLEPTNVDARHWYALVLMTSGRPAEAEQQMRAALALDPKALILRTNLGWLHYTNRQYPLAIQEMESVVQQNPDFLTAHYKLWWAYSVTRDTPHAMQELMAVARLQFKSDAAGKIAAAYEKHGYPAALEAATEATHEDPPYLLTDDARRLTFAGDQKASLQQLQRALASREGWLIFVESDPAFDALRSDPEYVSLVRELHAGSTASQTHSPTPARN
jgi:TolB-like protein/DNA-binding winged helix-turn-helix (wHTH) protein/Tfp pilus assembly protein PilF